MKWQVYSTLVTRVEIWSKNNVRLAVKKTFCTAKYTHLLTLNAVNFCGL